MSQRRIEHPACLDMPGKAAETDMVIRTYQ
jgi:hypothetical protein